MVEDVNNFLIWLTRLCESANLLQLPQYASNIQFSTIMTTICASLRPDQSYILTRTEQLHLHSYFNVDVTSNDNER